MNKKINFRKKCLPARENLLQFIERNIDDGFIFKARINGQRWLGELSDISGMLKENGFFGCEVFKQPPERSKDFRNISEDLFLYQGEINESKGLWKRELIPKEYRQHYQDREFKWIHYKVNSLAKVLVNEQFPNISCEALMPENFERCGEKIKKKNFLGRDSYGKRPIFRFNLGIDGIEEVYAKSSGLRFYFYHSYAKPQHRLTSVSDIQVTSALSEININESLSAEGVKVPRTIGYYDSITEQFAFFEGIRGVSPLEVIDKERETLIEQDAHMLASMCLAGYRKHGFEDFDDKVFYNGELYLIDSEDCQSLYSRSLENLINLLRDPSDSSELDKFRAEQRNIFVGTLRDALFSYQESLIRTPKEQMAYIRHFYEKMSWRTPSFDEIREIVSFPKDYMTADRHLSILSDCD
ncbi:hypothetical protein COU54_02060 [Candidatus Pacearchaeota archaeon CG10_big_fil_rev_8_21_14_0_10_31_24]|nr:MAG: hypothetical protein COU54_02060 [Candidatus Pacearchaeota archaeon CG10_big_fil_rev_8_21_14_0_10_31_24]